MRRILRRYRDRTIIPPRTNIPVIISQLNNNTTPSYQHIVYCTPNHNHCTVSTIPKFYPKKAPHTIPTPLDLDLQKAKYITTNSTTTFFHIPPVRNTSSNFTSTFPIPISTSLQQSTTNPILPTRNQLDYLTIHAPVPKIQTYHSYNQPLKSTDHRIPNTYSNNINTNSVIDKKKPKKKNRTFSRQSISPLHIKNTPNPIHTTHDLHNPITTYFPSTKKYYTYQLSHLHHYHKIQHNTKLI